MPLTAVIENVVQLVEKSVGPVHDQEMAVAATPQIEIAWLTALDPMSLRDRLVRDGIERHARAREVVHTVALIRVLKLDRRASITSVNDCVREAIVCAPPGVTSPPKSGCVLPR